jgi:hypothetical protein
MTWSVNVNPEVSMSPMSLLANGIPLSLLFDLVYGPESADLLSAELED